MAAPAMAQAMAAIPPPAAKSSTRLPAARVGIVEDVARQGLSARPCEGPERRLDVAFGEPGFGGLPDRGDLGGEMKLDLRHLPGGRQDGVGTDESGPDRSKPARQNGQADGQPDLPVGAEQAQAIAGSSISSATTCRASKAAGSTRAG